MMCVTSQNDLPSLYECNKPLYAPPTLYAFTLNSEDRVEQQQEQQERRPSLPPRTEADYKEEENTDTEPISYRSGGSVVTEKGDFCTISVLLPAGIKASNLKLVYHGEGSMLEMRADSDFSQSLFIDNAAADVSKIEAQLIYQLLTIQMPKMNVKEPLAVPIVPKDPPLDPQAHLHDDIFWTMDVPGVKLCNLKVTYHKKEMVVDGQRKILDGSLSNVHRVFSINDSVINAATLEAYLMDGVLTFKASRRVTPPTRSIEVSICRKKQNDSKEKKAEISDQELLFYSSKQL
jgi:HSP20 family molecular chaperone IbpA